MLTTKLAFWKYVFIALFLVLAFLLAKAVVPHGESVAASFDPAIPGEPAPRDPNRINTSRSFLLGPVDYPGK